MFGGEWAKRVFHRIVKWGDGWLPAVQNVEQIIDGRQQLKTLALQAGRDPDSIRIRVFGGQGQWRTRKDVDPFAAAGVEEIIIWLEQPDCDGIRTELDTLASELL